MLVNVAERIKELAPYLRVDYSSGEFHYSIVGGYERLSVKTEATHGWFTIEGAYHPNVVCEGGEVCKWCGSVIPNNDGGTKH